MKVEFEKQGSVPSHIESMTHQEFAERSGALTGVDLYWILRRAATEGPNSAAAFEDAIAQQLDARVGLDNYHYFLAIDCPDLRSDIFNPDGQAHFQCLFWGGAAGVLPGFGAHHAVQIVVTPTWAS